MALSQIAVLLFFNKLVAVTVLELHMMKPGPLYSRE